MPFDVNEDDVVIGTGVSGCLRLVFDALLDEGDNILVPCPTIPLYKVMNGSNDCLSETQSIPIFLSDFIC